MTTKIQKGAKLQYRPILTAWYHLDNWIISYSCTSYCLLPSHEVTVLYVLFFQPHQGKTFLNFSRIRSIIKKKVDENRSTYTPGQIRHFIDLYLQVQQDKESQKLYTGQFKSWVSLFTCWYPGSNRIHMETFFWAEVLFKNNQVKRIVVKNKQKEFILYKL